MCVCAYFGVTNGSVRGNHMDFVLVDTAPVSSVVQFDISSQSCGGASQQRVHVIQDVMDLENDADFYKSPYSTRFIRHKILLFFRPSASFHDPLEQMNRR